MSIALFISLASTLGGALFIMLFSVTPLYSKARAFWLTLAFLLLSLAALLTQERTIFSTLIYPELFNHALIFDTFALLFLTIVTFGTLFTLIVSQAFIYSNDFFKGETFTLMLFAIFGMQMLPLCNELFTAFIALEISSMSIYVLVGINKHSLKGSEATLKYLLLGSFTGAFYLLGLMLIFAQAGTTNLQELAVFIAQHSFRELALVIAGGLLIMITFMFKIAAFPFGIWVLEVYRGASLPITAFMAGSFKIAVFSIILRLFLVDYESLKSIYDPLIITAAVITLLAGTLLAVSEHNLKRMLAASSIVHSGYLLIALASVAELGSIAAYSIIFYLIAYFLSAVGTFAILSYIEQRDSTELDFNTIKGLSHRYPILSVALTIFMLSLAGFPSTIGFIGKFYIFSGAIDAGLTWLALIGILAAFISIFYYFRLIAMLYFHQSAHTKRQISSPLAYVFILFLALSVLWGGIGTGLITFLPGTEMIITIAKSAIESLAHYLVAI